MLTLALLPPLPAWEHLHPIIVHVPLGGLIAAPLLAIIAGVSKKSRMVAGLCLMAVLVVGVAGAFVAAESGEAAEDAVSIPAQAVTVLEHHEELAELTRNILLAIALAYAGILGTAAIIKEKFKRPFWIGAHVLMLAALAGAMISLANTGHEGGRLVHEFGVRAHIIGSPPAINTGRGDTGHGENHD